jgi:hypothetical protein
LSTVFLNIYYNSQISTGQKEGRSGGSGLLGREPFSGAPGFGQCAPDERVADRPVLAGSRILARLLAFLLAEAGRSSFEVADLHLFFSELPWIGHAHTIRPPIFSKFLWYFLGKVNILQACRNQGIRYS